MTSAGGSIFSLKLRVEAAEGAALSLLARELSDSLQSFLVSKLLRPRECSEGVWEQFKLPNKTAVSNKKYLKVIARNFPKRIEV